MMEKRVGERKWTLAYSQDCGEDDKCGTKQDR